MTIAGKPNGHQVRQILVALGRAKPDLSRPWRRP